MTDLGLRLEQERQTLRRCRALEALGKIIQIGAEAPVIDLRPHVYPGIITTRRYEREAAAVKEEFIGGYCQLIDFLRVEPGNEYMVRARADFPIDQRHQGMAVKKIHRPLEARMTPVVVFFQAVAVTFKLGHALAGRKIDFSHRLTLDQNTIKVK